MEEQVRSEGFEWLKALGVAIIIFFVVQTFFFTSYVVKGQSMNPTLDQGNKLVVNKVGHELGDLKRYEVIVFHANEKDDYVKRIIGLPGETVEYKDDTLFINGNAVKEPYLDQHKKEVFQAKLTGDFTLPELTGEQKVPEGKVFVLGDNRERSFDSRHFGFVDSDKIVGKVNLKYWPLKEWEVTF